MARPARLQIQSRSIEYQGALGTIAARLGRREDAQRVAQELRDLDRPYLRGIHTLWRARIAESSLRGLSGRTPSAADA